MALNGGINFCAGLLLFLKIKTGGFKRLHRQPVSKQN